MRPFQRPPTRRGPYRLSLSLWLLLIRCWISGPSPVCAGDVVMNATVGGAPIGNRSPAPIKGCWVFTHLQKCGGTTVKEILLNYWGDRREVYDSPEWKTGDNHTEHYGQRLVVGDRLNVVAGGYAEALRDPVGMSCKWFTLFRHPIPRLVSAYFYCKERPIDWVCASDVVRAEDLDLLGFARHWGNFAVRQFALNFVKADEVIEFVKGGGVVREKGDPVKLPGWYLLKNYLEHKGNMRDEDEVAVLSRMLHPVRDLLTNNFTAVGILEEFNATLDLYNSALEMPGFDWHNGFNTTGIMKLNNMYSEKEKTLREAWTSADIKEQIDLDLLLYEHALDIFYDQIDVLDLGVRRSDVLAPFEGEVFD